MNNNNGSNQSRSGYSGQRYQNYNRNYQGFGNNYGRRNNRSNRTGPLKKKSKPTIGPVAVIPLKPDYDESKVSKIKHKRTIRNNNEEEVYTVEVPKLSENYTKYELLNFVREFREASNVMNWTTGPALYQKFAMHLTGINRTDWNTMTHGGQRTVQSFRDNISEFIAKSFTGQDYNDQMDYLRALRKPKEMDPVTFERYFRIANSLVQLLPDAPIDAGFEEMELKRAYIKAQPVTWQTKFDDANLSYQTEEMSDIVQYFQKQAIRDPYKPKTRDNTNDERSSSRNSRGGRFNRSSRDNRFYNGFGSNYGGSYNNNNNRYHLRRVHPPGNSSHEGWPSINLQYLE